MLRFLLFSTFTILFFIGCNSERAELRRIETYLTPRMIQLGILSRLYEGGNEDTERCEGIAYNPRTESTYCVGSTKSYFAELPGGSRDALIIKFDRKFNIEWAKQYGQFSRETSNVDVEAFYDIQIDNSGFLYVGGLFNNQFLLFKMNPEGNIIWRRVLEGRCSRIRLKDGIYCSGLNNTADAYVSKWSFQGQRIWEKSLTNIEFPVSDHSQNDYCQGLAVSPSGVVACVGNTASKLTSTYIPDTGRLDGFIWLLNSNDGSSRQVIQLGTKFYNEEIITAEFDSKANLFIAGNFQGSNKLPAAPDDDFNTSELNTTTRHTFFVKYKYDGSNYVRDYSWNTNIAGQTKPKRIMMIGDSKFIVCLETFGTLFETRAEVSTSDLAVGLVRTSDLNFEKGIQFGASTTGAISNIGNQDCRAIARDVFGNILVAGTTDGSTHETNPNAGTDDIMIWRVGPNLEF